MVLLVCALIISLLFGNYEMQYETTDPADYGNYVGNYDNTQPREIISSFFPAQIDDYFSNVQYSYRAEQSDAYAFEAYLEFTIEDPSVFDAYINTATANLDGLVCQYDPSFIEYTLSDTFRPNAYCLEPDKCNSEALHIEYADIEKILCNYDEQTVIYVALGVYDGGAASTDYFTVYFDRFDIDPWQYGKVSTEDMRANR